MRSLSSRRAFAVCKTPEMQARSGCSATFRQACHGWSPSACRTLCLSRRSPKANPWKRQLKSAQHCISCAHEHADTRTRVHTHTYRGRERERERESEREKTHSKEQSCGLRHLHQLPRQKQHRRTPDMAGKLPRQEGTPWPKSRQGDFSAWI